MRPSRPAERRLPGRTTLTIASAVLALALAGCGGNDAVSSGDDAEQWIADNTPVPASVTIESSQCVRASDGQFECRVDVATSEGRQTVTGTLVCESEECLWRDG